MLFISFGACTGKMTKLTVYQYPTEKMVVIEERDTEKE
jgi:hypothetical protein